MLFRSNDTATTEIYTGWYTLSLHDALPISAGSGGKLFGSITANDIATAVKHAGGPLLDRKRIQLPGHIKTLGSHDVTVELHPDVVATVPVKVTAV